MAQLDTKLVIRNDSLANWEANKGVVLMKGEMGIAFDTDGKTYIKIGDGIKSWEELGWHGEGQGSEAVGASFFDVEMTIADTDHMAAIERVVGEQELLDGDVAVVRSAISEGKYTYTGYTYADGEWKAMDGNYNAENVYFDEDLETTTAIGNITLTNGKATIPSTGKNLKEVWEAIFIKEKNPSTTQPSVKITFSAGGEHEVGETVSTTYSITLDPGKYTYGPATGVTMNAISVVDTLGVEKTAATGSFEDIVVTDAMKSEDDGGYSITATATYGDGTVPVTNRGNAYAAGQIKGGSKSATSEAIVGYRNTFWGTLEDKTIELTSSVIRSLSGKSGTGYANGSTFDLEVPVGAMRVIFAYPADLQNVSSVIDENGLNAQIASSFAANMKTVQVEGANGAIAIDYKVYYMDLSEANGTANVFHVTI